MSKYWLIYIVVFFVFVFFACQRELSEKQLWEYVKNPNHGLYHQKVIGDNIVEIIFKPTDIAIYQHIKTIDSYSQTAKDSIKENLNQYWFFKLDFSYDNNEVLTHFTPDRHKYNQLSNELSFRMNNNVRCITNLNDTVYLFDYSFPRIYNYSTSNQLLLVFENETLKNATHFTVEVDEFGLEIGKQEFQYLINDIRKTPALKIEELN